MLTLRRAPSLVAEAPALDDVQQAALAHRGGVLRVLGGPGTGKTTTAIEAVVARVESGRATPDQCLVLTSSRVAAGSLRERVTARLGGTSTEPLARTHQALGFGILRQAAALRGDPTPRLLSGPEQDVILRELLAGHAAGEGTGPGWPERVHVALAHAGFRAELRDLLMRAVERGLEPDDLARLGREHDRPEWVAAASVLAEYDEVTAFSRARLLRPGLDPRRRGRPARRRPDGARPAARRAAPRRRRRRPGADLGRGPAAATWSARRGIDLILLGDPDSAVQTFRGADPRLLGDGWTGSRRRARRWCCRTAYRLPQALRAVSRAGAPPTIGAARRRWAHRAAVAVRRRWPGRRARCCGRSARRRRYVAAELREAHLRRRRAVVARWPSSCAARAAPRRCVAC